MQLRSFCTTACIQILDIVGSCWSIASAGAVESVVKINAGKLRTLSAQKLTECDKLNDGCKRGWMSKAYAYIVSNKGITSNDT